MKFLEITKREAQDCLRNNCNLNIVVLKGMEQEYYKEVFIEANDSGLDIDEIITSIMVNLPNRDYYSFKFYEVWC